MPCTPPEPDLSDHPFAIHMATESYVSPYERRWLAWVKKAEKLLGHSIDGDQDRDGYSLDGAHDAFADGLTIEEYVQEVRTGRDEPDDACTDPSGHEWAYSGTAYGGDDDSYFGEGRCYCVHCGADGDA